jgi:L-ribulose-5-phosphate 3-epimerase
MFLGYNTNGLAHHALTDAVGLLAEIGYRGVAVTIDHHALPPGASDTAARLEGLRRLLERLGMRSVIETGARFLLDPRQKHEPTLVSADPAGRRRRIDFYRHAIDCAAALQSDCVSLWSGAVRDGATDGEAVGRLVEGLREVLDYAAERGVTVGFEPEPGMLIDRMERFDELLGRIDAPLLGLTLDVGHPVCLGAGPLPDLVDNWAPRLVNVHMDDMGRGRHEHLMFGQGEVDIPAVLGALKRAGYRRGLYVELSRHSREGPQAARQAFDFLTAALDRLA